MIALLLPLLAAGVVGYLIGQQSRAKAVRDAMSDIVPVVVALRNLLDVDPMDANQHRLRRTEANLVLDQFMSPRRRQIG